MKIILLFLLVPVCGYATSITVSNPAQLISAFATADVAGATNTIIINAGTYVLSSSITFGNNNNETLTIVTQGGAVIIQGPSTDKILTLNASGSFLNLNVSITGVTFEDGNANDILGGGAILAGGPGNTTTFTNCSFLNNAVAPAAGGADGGAVHMSGGGAFTFTNCSFMNNSTADGNGGALAYFVQTVAGSLTVTGCTFQGNSIATFEGLTIGGGAIQISAASGISSSISITQNKFLSNTNPQGAGGAIDIEYVGSANAIIKYNRFYKNTAGSFPDVAMAPTSGGGNVEITDNWWGRNVSPVSATDPHAGMTGSGGSGSLIVSSFMELTSSVGSAGICSGTGGNSTVVTTGFTRNSAGGTIAAANLGAFVGLSMTFSSTQGALTGSQGSIQSNGSETVTFTDNGVAGTDDIHPVVDSVGVSDPLAVGVVTVTAPASLASASASSTFTVGSGTSSVTDGSCNDIASLIASGASPVSGSVTASVTLDGSVQSYQGVPYVTRHYDITPASNASSSTATVTLYFLQSEFNAYNAVVNNPAMALPASSSDAAGAARLTITQYHGSGTLPGNYSGWTGSGPASVLISPGSSNVIWNSAKNWWEVSFPVAGFSGFYVAGPVGLPLPVRLERFTGVMQGTRVLLKWQVADEVGFLRYEVEGSAGGVAFSPLGVVAAGASGAGGAGAYQYFVGNPWVGENFYRLKMVNDDGTFTYSPVVVVDVTSGGRGVVVLSNPFTTSCTLRVTAVSGGPVSVRLMDLSGRLLSNSVFTLVAGVNTFVLPGTSGLASGVYVVSLVGGEMRETVKVVKE